jgi:SOS-response transcriptional repressor LexA
MKNGDDDYPSRLRSARDEAGLSQVDAVAYLKSKGFQVSQKTISNWERGRTRPRDVDGEAVIEALKAYSGEPARGARPGAGRSRQTIGGGRSRSSVSLPLLSISAQAGEKSSVWDTQVRSYMTIDTRILRSQTGADPERMAVMSVSGDSMEPQLRAGDQVVIVRHSDGEPVVEGVVYVWRSAHRGVIIKRAHWLDSDTLELVSDNDRYSPIRLEAGERDDWHCIGRVVRVLQAV